MKNIVRFKCTIALITFSILTVVSCSDVEPIDPAVLLNPGPVNPNPTNPENPGTSTGDYWPSALNNEWAFERNGVEIEPMKMVSINSIANKTYYTFNEQTAMGGGIGTTTAVTRLRKEGAAYYIKVDDFTTQANGATPGSTTTGSENIVLRDDLPVGGTWTSSYTQTTTFTDTSLPVMAIDFVIDGTIMEKNAIVTIGDETYNNVIKTKYVQTATMAGQSSTTTTYYWFAKDIGPIRILTEADPVDLNTELISYILN